MNISVMVMVVSLVLIMIAVMAWQIITKRSRDEDLKKVANVTASSIFWVVVAVAIVLAVVSGLR